MIPPVGVAVIGAGHWGPNIARNVAACDRTRLAWVCDLSEERAVAAAAGRCRSTTNLDAIWRDPTVGAVAIATPASTHGELVHAALRAGKHVLVEKPLATSAADAERIDHLAAGAARVVMVDHTYCYSPAFAAATRALDTMLPAVVDSVRCGSPGASDVDVLWDLVPHDVAVIMQLVPWWSPKTVTAHMAAGTAYVTIAGEPLVSIRVGWSSPVKTRRLTFSTAEGSHVVWDDLAADRVTRDGAAVPVAAGEALSGVIERFVDAIELGRSPNLSVARLAVSIIEAAHRSLIVEGPVLL